MSSGVGMGSFMTGTPEKRADFWKEVMAKTGAKKLEEFRKVSPEVLFREWKNAKGGMASASPVKDGILIKDKAKPKNIPYMVGSTSHDIAPAMLHPMTRKWGAKNGSYVWHFERMLPGDDKGAWHSSDLWYWFGTLKNCWRPMEERDFTLSDEMSSYLCNFVKTGNPNGDGLPHWNKSIKAKDVMLFSDKATFSGKPDMTRLIKITLTNKPVGE